jgi:hypothetical protein
MILSLFSPGVLQRSQVAQDRLSSANIPQVQAVALAERPPLA